MNHLPIILFITVALVSQPARAAEPEAQAISVAEAQTQLAKSIPIQLLDVRTEEEWNEGHLQGAIRIELGAQDFPAKVAASFDKSMPLLVYCRSGRRSAAAAKQLRAAGFSRVVELQGGILAWQAAGMPVEK